MRIAALTLNGLRGWPAIDLSPVMLGLNVFYGPAGSGKTTVCQLLAHVLYGQPPIAAGRGGAEVVPEGEVVIESGGTRYRLRRQQIGGGPRLTVSSLDGTAVDRDTVRRLLGGVSPLLLRRLCAISFREPPQIEWLLTPEFAREFGASGTYATTTNTRRTADLLARRDTLAKELEARLAGEGRASRDLETRRRDLDRQISEAEREARSIEERLRAVEAALTETDMRLRYRRLELNADRTWWGAAPIDWETQLAELDSQIARWRTALAELAAREATVRGRLAQVQPGASAVTTAAVDEEAWLAVARQLAADLSGEVARLARASASQQCVCRDAHPRLRPIVETFQRQLDVLGKLISERQQALAASELEAEASHLARSQVELSRQLEYLLGRREGVARGPQPARRVFANGENSSVGAAYPLPQASQGVWITAADAEQLERRRLELEQQRFELSQQISAQDGVLRDLRAQRATVDRQRAALLSSRSIEHVQRELMAVQQKLQQALQSEAAAEDAVPAGENSPRVSDVLAKLTNGRLVRLQLVEAGRRLVVQNSDGTVVGAEALSGADRTLVYLSFSLALVPAIARHRLTYPLLLDEPFVHLDDQETAALAAVLDDLGRHGQQIVVFTGQREAADRMASLGAPVRDLSELRLRDGEQQNAASAAPLPAAPAIHPVASKTSETVRSVAKNGKRAKVRRLKRTDQTSTSTDHNDAA